MNITMHEDYFLKEWIKRYNQQPENIKKKLDKLSKKINLLDSDLFFEEFEAEVYDGDIFVIQVKKGKFLYGKVLSTKSKIFDDEYKIQSEYIILLYKQISTELIMPSKQLKFDDLLLSPQLTTRYLFNSGFAKIIGNIPLTDLEKNIDIGFLNKYQLTLIDDDNNIKIEDHETFYNINGDIIDYKPKYISSTRVQGLDIIRDIAKELIMDSNILGEEYLIPTGNKGINIKKLVKEDVIKNKLNVAKFKSILDLAKFTKNIEGYYFEQILGYTVRKEEIDAIVIFEQDTSRYVNYINTHNIENVIVKIVEEGVESLNFLHDIPHVKHLIVEHLIIEGKIDYSPIYKLKNLKSLSISGDSKIKVDQIDGLELLSINNPNSIIINKEVPSLKTLMISSQGIKTKSNDLQFLKYLNKLDTLVLEHTNIKTLNGIEFLKNLKFLTLVYNRKLYNIDALAEINGLNHLRIEYCNKVEKLDAIREHKELIYLGLHSMKSIQSIRFLSKLNKLKSFVLVESNVFDGDMTSIINLQEAVVLPIKKHYYKIVNGEKIKIKESDFTYGNRDWGKEDIDLWRRLDNRY